MKRIFVAHLRPLFVSSFASLFSYGCGVLPFIRFANFLSFYWVFLELTFSPSLSWPFTWFFFFSVLDGGFHALVLYARRLASLHPPTDKCNTLLLYN